MKRIFKEKKLEILENIKNITNTLQERISEVV
jgi:hypothetical protein